jgi:hypothetical protein
MTSATTFLPLKLMGPWTAGFFQLELKLVEAQAVAASATAPKSPALVDEDIVSPPRGT